MSNASLLRKTNRKIICLEAATKAAVEAGDLQEGQEVTIQIRKVRASEVAAVVGTPPRLFDLSRAQGDESEEERRQRIKSALQEDPNVVQDSIRKSDEQARAVIALGVAGPDPVTLDGANDSLVPEDFGDDYHLVHDAIVEFSSLPYTRLGGAGMAAFPAKQVADDPVEDGGTVRDDAEQPAA